MRGFVFINLIVEGMRMSLKLRNILLICCVLLVTAGVLCTLFFEQKTPPYGHLSLYVIDAYTLRPLADAVIVLPESGITGKTNARGMALISSIPVDTDAAFNRLTGAEYGEITMLIYAEGYLPCVWLKVHMFPSRIRSGSTVYMFPVGSEEVKVTVFTEAPDEEMMLEFLRRHRPAQFAD